MKSRSGMPLPLPTSTSVISVIVYNLRLDRVTVVFGRERTAMVAPTLINF
jgi:hypothetical protein